tara:strand:- start:998 stop:1387 length:390 start_codon:yes stop_codon:yes gene_type:complete
MAKNYTLNVALNMSAVTSTGYTQGLSGAFAMNITGVDQVATGRIDCATDGDATIMAAPGYGKAIYVRNLDNANVLEVYGGASSDNDLLGVLKAGEFLFTILRDTDTVTARGLGGTVTAEYFAVEIDANA